MHSVCGSVSFSGEHHTRPKAWLMMFMMIPMMIPMMIARDGLINDTNDIIKAGLEAWIELPLESLESLESLQSLNVSRWCHW